MAITTKSPAKTAEKKEAPANVAPATEFEPSGAPSQVPAIDVDHPAVDNDPREGTTADMNRIDFNDPTITDEEAVNRNLKEAGRP